MSDGKPQDSENVGLDLGISGLLSTDNTEQPSSNNQVPASTAEGDSAIDQGSSAEQEASDVEATGPVADLERLIKLAQAQPDQWGAVVHFCEQREIESSTDEELRFFARFAWILAQLEQQAVPESIISASFEALIDGASMEQIDRIRPLLAALGERIISGLVGPENERLLVSLRAKLQERGLFNSVENIGVENIGPVEKEGNTEESSSREGAPNFIIGKPELPIQESRVTTSLPTKNSRPVIKWVLLLFLLCGLGGIIAVLGVTPILESLVSLTAGIWNKREAGEIAPVVIPAQSSPQALLQGPVNREVMKPSQLDAVYYEMSQRSAPAPTAADTSSATAVVSPERSQDNTSSSSGSSPKQILSMAGPIEDAEFQARKERALAADRSGVRVMPSDNRSSGIEASATGGSEAQEPRPALFPDPKVGDSRARSPVRAGKVMLVREHTNIMAGPTWNAVVLAALLPGDRIEVDGVEGEWVRVVSKRGLYGYVPADKLRN